MNTTLTYDEFVAKIATIEQRIKTDTKINMFDRSLIIADIYDIDKQIALIDLLSVRKNLTGRND